MPEFRYEGYAAPGQRVDGRVIADSEQDVVDILLRQGLAPVNIRPARTHRRAWGEFDASRPLRHRERADLARQLSDLIRAGMPVLGALRTLQDLAQSARYRRVTTALHAQVEGGHPLGEAMAGLPRDFSAVQVSLVRAGEMAGMLTVVLDQIADLDDREHELRGRVQAAMIYPSTTAVVGAITIFLILTFVTPRLAGIFTEMGRDLPAITRVLMSFSGAAQWVWRHLLFVGAGAAALALLLARIKGLSLLRDRWMLRLPRLGRLTWSLQVARFASILGAMLRNGVPMVRALEVSVGTLENRVIAQRLRRVIERVNGGQRLGEAIAAEEAMPVMVSGMISVGERTGELETTLDRIGSAASRDADHLLRILVGLVEPALIIVLGISWRSL